ncbi:MAG: Crp/Fnr family transcriptional regulator [Pseudomonadales bacterium]
MAASTIEKILEYFPALAALEPSALATFERYARLAELPAGTTVFEAGSPCSDFLMVATGRVRVQQVSAEGREIVLYRIGGAEPCILTTACLLAHQDYSAEAVTETAVTGLLLSRAGFDLLLGESARFRELVFASFASRIADLMRLVEDVAFGHVDIRLAQRLLELADDGGAVTSTLQGPAVELGTAREVISRHIKEFERRGHVDLERGRIILRDRQALEALAASKRV